MRKVGGFFRGAAAAWLASSASQSPTSMSFWSPWVARAAGLLAEASARLTGRTALLNRDKVCDILARYWVCTIEKARNQGFVPRVVLRAGLEETVDWYRASGWL